MPHAPNRLGSVLLLALSAGTLICTAGAQELAWKTGRVTPRPQTAAERTAVLDALASAPNETHCVVQFAAPPDENCKADCQARGIKLLDYVGGNAYFAALADVRATKGLSQARGIQAILPIDADWKLDPNLLDPVAPPWAKIGEDAAGNEWIGGYVLFHRDIDLETIGRTLINHIGGDVVGEIRTLNGLVVEAPAAALVALAVDDRVRYCEPALPAWTETNAENRAVTGANIAQAAPYNLDGAGVTVMVYDGGRVRDTHQDFGGRVRVGDAAGLSNHATHVAGTIGGSGAASGGAQRGMAPGVQIVSYGYQTSGGGGGIILYTNPGDMEQDYTNAIHTWNADIANNSIGTNVNINNFSCTILGNYGTVPALVDAIVYGELGEPFRVVFANGNERGGSARCGAAYNTTGPPATAKNHITVGNVNANEESVNSSSSWGPVDDGRLKPDLVAPGCQIGGDGGVTSTGSSSDTAYTTLCGTSMASPTVTGCAALLLEDWRSRFGDPLPRNALLKAFFVHTAQDLESPGPDFKSGYGSLRVVPAIDLMRSGNFVEAEVAQGEAYGFEVEASAGLSQLRFTLAWDDPPAAPNVTISLVNDLDLVLIDPSGVEHFPWTLQPTIPSAAAVRTHADRRNNLEQVQVDAPQPGIWRVEVRGFAVPEGPQVFALVGDVPFAVQPAVQISLPGGPPTALQPGAAYPLMARVTAIADELTAPPQLWFRYATGPFEARVMAAAELPNHYVADLPPPACGATPEFYITAEGALFGAASSPLGAPSSVWTAAIGAAMQTFADDFNVDRGWTVENSPELTDGWWERGPPMGSGSWGDPRFDADGSGQCYLTRNLAGNSDVDGGSTFLISPRLDLSGGDAEVRYSWWLVNTVGDSPSEDPLNVYVSNDDGATWLLANVHGPLTAPGWNAAMFRVGALLAPTANVRVRFEARDLGGQSVVEAAIDAFEVLQFSCDASLPDCDGNGIVDADDIASGRLPDADDDGVPDPCQTPLLRGDTNCDGVVNVADVESFVLALTDPNGYAVQHPACDILHADVSEDGRVTVSDVAFFVTLLLQP